MFVLPIIALSAHAATLNHSVGLQVAMAKDLPDRVEWSESTEFLIGPAFVVPARISTLGGLLFVRSTLEVHLSLIHI